MKRIALLFAAAVLLGGTEALSAQDTNGKNVVFVTYRGEDGRVGAFRQAGEGRWIEQNQDGRFDFMEVNRDDWSVYLRDRTRRMNLQLDLHTRRVNTADAMNRTPRQLYSITNARPWSDGRLVTRVIATGGRNEVEFVQTENGWIERELPTNATKFRYREANRDDWSVYLHDESRNVNIQLDLHTRRVNYSEGSGPSRQIYTITLAVH
jgi:hypothetical protein